MPEDAAFLPASGHRASPSSQGDSGDDKDAPHPAEENETPEELPEREFEQQTVDPGELPTSEFEEEEPPLPEDLDDDKFLEEGQQGYEKAG